LLNRIETRRRQPLLVARCWPVGRMMPSKSVVAALGWELSTAMLEASDVLVVLDQLERVGLVVWLDGGWGVDALLGYRSRPHRDLDLVIARDDCAAAQHVLSGMGFRPDLTAVPGLPARLVLVDAGDRQVDLHRVVFDWHGNGWQELGEDAWGAYPAEELTGVGMVGGRRVCCVTPQLQVRHHLGYPLKATDRHDLGLLAERFGVAVPPTIQLPVGGQRPDRSSDPP
jgi:lincosamide nucleotidyltransferase A/C/D/E